MSEIMGKRLKYLREKSGLQQKFVAGKIGVKNNTLSGYESGIREPDSETLTKLADFYGVTTDYLHGRTGDPSLVLSTKANKLDDDYRKIERFARKVSSKEREKALNLLKLAFEDAFNEEEDDDDDL